MVLGLFKGIIGLGRLGMDVAKTAWGPVGFGVFGITKRLMMPALILGGFGAMRAGQGLLNAPYDIHSPRAAWGYTPGMTAPYTQYPMEFSSIPRNIDMGATGSLAFALHNNRKT